ncbi:MAG: sugar phosphate nucleotidyltransferase [Bacteroidota bacterium]
MNARHPRAVLLPGANDDAFTPVTYRMPAGLLPVVNKPLWEHAVEYLCRYGIREILIGAGPAGEPVVDHFGDGSAWGAAIGFDRGEGGPMAALRRMEESLGGSTTVVMEGTVVSGLDLAGALEFHAASRADATFLCAVVTGGGRGSAIAHDGDHRIRAVRLRGAPAAAPYIADCGICILEPEILALVPDGGREGLLAACWQASGTIRLNLYACLPGGPVARISGWRSYHKVQTDILAGRFPHIVIPGTEVRKGLWMGRGVVGASDVSFEGPAVIGDGCRLGSNVRIGGGTVLGQGVIVQAGCSMERAIVLPRTYISPRARIRDSIIQGNLHIGIREETGPRTGVGFQPSTVPPRRFRARVYRRCSQALALLVLAALGPWLLILASLLVAGGMAPLGRVKRMGVDLSRLLEGKLQLRVFTAWYLGPLRREEEGCLHPSEPATVLPGGVARLGNLLNAARGDIMLIGNRPLDPEFAFSITEQWQRTRFTCQAGLFGILDAFNSSGMTQEERLLTEGYYAVSRTFRTDLVIASRVLLRPLLTPLGRWRAEAGLPRGL